MVFLSRQQVFILILKVWLIVVTPDGNGGMEVIANMLPEEWSQL